MHGLFVLIVMIGLMVHVSVFIVVTVCECLIELKGYLLACLLCFDFFYRAKPSGAWYCQGKLSVGLSVRLAVCNVEVS